MSKMNRAFFLLGFILSLGSIVAVNLHSYLMAEPPCCHLSESFGFPFPLGEHGGYFTVTSLFIPGLIADIVVGIIASVAFGRLFAEWTPSLINQYRKIVQWHLATRS